MTDRLEIKASIVSTDEGEIVGIAWPFGTPDSVGDIIEKGAFSASNMPIPMLFGHNPNEPIGAWTSIEETDEGLIVKGRLLVNDVARAAEARALASAGGLSGLSIGFEKTKSVPRRDAVRGRIISNLNLVEISLVAIPAHPGARIRSIKSASNARSLADIITRASARFTLKK